MTDTTPDTTPDTTTPRDTRRLALRFRIARRLLELLGAQMVVIGDRDGYSSHAFRDDDHPDSDYADWLRQIADDLDRP